MKGLWHILTLCPPQLRHTPHTPRHIYAKSGRSGSSTKGRTPERGASGGKRGRHQMRTSSSPSVFERPVVITQSERVGVWVRKNVHDIGVASRALLALVGMIARTRLRSRSR